MKQPNMAEDPISKFIWENFVDQTELWGKIYESFASKAAHDITRLIALKSSIMKQRENTYNNYGPREQEYFENTLSRLKQKFDPDIHLENLQNTLLCITLSENSYLSERYGTKEICGKFVGLTTDTDTKIKSKATNTYETKTGSICFEFNYPTADDLVRITYYDIEHMDLF